MFRIEIEELFYFQAKEPLLSKYNVVNLDRENIVLYDFDTYKWLLVPNDMPFIYEEDIDHFKKTHDTKVLFSRRDDFSTIIHHDLCRRLTYKDRYKFEEFMKACPSPDKDKGMVSLEDPVVYGCFTDNKLVSVATLWHWGNNLSDIGVLTHPDYRGKGFAQSVCEKLMSENERLYIWRCDCANNHSLNLAFRLGFEEAGSVYYLEK